MLFYTDSADLQNCPAEVDMETGDIYVNKDVWDTYSDAERDFVLKHEQGHYLLQTDSETEADNYALKSNFGKIKGSLRSGFTSLEKAGVKDIDRWNALYENALKIDAFHGNKKAQDELDKINNFNKPKKQNKMRANPGQITYIMPNTYTGVKKINVRSKFNPSGGGEENPSIEITSQKSHKTNGIVLGNFYMSFTNILLLAIVVILIAKLK